MRVSAELAWEESAQCSVTREHVQHALRILAESGLDYRARTEKSIGDFPQDAYMYLEKRLHNLRMLVVRSAARQARNDDLTVTVEATVFATPDQIESSWQIITNDSCVLWSVFLSGDAAKD